jgi:hypothetical protein
MSKELWIAAHERLVEEGVLEYEDSSEEACKLIDETYADMMGDMIDQAYDRYKDQQMTKGS